MTRYVLIAVLALCASCKKQTRGPNGGLVYIRDSRTDLCYAGYRADPKGLGGDPEPLQSMVVVPCEKVQHLLEKE